MAMPRTIEARRDGDAWWFEVDGRELRLSNLTKIFWPDEGYTKGDLLDYYFNVGHLIVPHLAERPLTMKRMPDGIDGESFYEKSAPSHTPDWLGRCVVQSDDAKKGEIDYLTIDDAAGLLYVANLGCIEFHPLHARCSDITHPDYLFFDLDPFEPYTYEDVLTVGRHIKVLLDQLGLTSFPKTSGATGLQIFVPILRGAYTHDTVRAFVGAAGRMIKQADPDRVTMAWKIADRTGKIFIDHNMNRSGANISAAYSVRPELRAPVSTPLTWDEVFEGGFEPQDFRIDNVWDRFERLGDLFDGVRTEAMDLTHALEALGVVDEDEPEPAMDAPLPRTAAPSTRAKTSEEVAAASKDPALFEYVRRRDFGPEGTTEPAPGDVAAATGNSFVIHKHRATRLHYDVRLEKDGALPALGGAQGPAHGQGRQAPRGAHRGPPAGVRLVRGHDPRGPLRRGRGPHLRRRLVRARGMDRLEGQLPPARPALPRPGVPLREDQHGLAGVPGQRAIGAADPGARAVPADAGRGRLGGVRRRRVVVRAQARRDPVPRRALHGRDRPADPARPRRHRPVPRAAHGARAGRPGERRRRRRDRGVRRGEAGTRSRRCSGG